MQNFAPAALDAYMVRKIYSNSQKLTDGTRTDTFGPGGSGGAQGPLLIPIIGACGARVSLVD